MSDHKCFLNNRYQYFSHFLHLSENAYGPVYSFVIKDKPNIVNRLINKRIVSLTVL